MTNKPIRFKWKQTTSKRKVCELCDKELFGEEGFIEIRVHNFWSYLGEDTFLCWTCFLKKVEYLQIQAGTLSERRKKFKPLYKKRILRSIEK